MLMVAQDTGTAIRGAARGDVFFGADGEAATLAGYMKSPGRMIVLLPKQLAARLQRQAP
jgi:peptidoglycan lytic transglycosylase A